jgi:hypothetical protein
MGWGDSLVTSALKMKTERFSEMLASISQYTWRLNPEDHHHHHHCENLNLIQDGVDY